MGKPHAILHSTEAVRRREDRKSQSSTPSAPSRHSTRMSEIWIQCFSCCVTDEPPPKRRHRIDRSMIGSPTNFIHTGHVGSGDMNVELNSLQHQMASKGGYDFAIPVSVQIPVVDVKN